MVVSSYYLILIVGISNSVKEKKEYEHEYEYLPMKPSQTWQLAKLRKASGQDRLTSIGIL